MSYVVGEVPTPDQYYAMYTRSDTPPASPAPDAPSPSTTPTPPSAAGGETSWITPDMMKQFGPAAAAAGLSVLQFVSTFFPALAAQQQQEALRRQQAAAAAAQKSNLSQYALPLLVVGVGGVLAWQVARKRKRGGAPATA